MPGQELAKLLLKSEKKSPGTNSALISDSEFLLSPLYKYRAAAKSNRFRTVAV